MWGRGLDLRCACPGPFWRRDLGGARHGGAPFGSDVSLKRPLAVCLPPSDDEHPAPRPTQNDQVSSAFDGNDRREESSGRPRVSA